MTDEATRSRGRPFAEGLVIVVSILLAFTLDAGWDGYQDQRRLDDKIEQLQQQLVENRADLTRALDRNLNSANQLALFLESTPAELVVLGDSVAAGITLALLAKNFYDQNGGAVESLVASPDMELIDDPDLRRLLALWSTLPDELEEDAAAATWADNDVRAMMVTYGLTVPTLAVASRLDIPGAGDLSELLSRLRSEPRVVDVIALKYSGVGSYAQNLEAMEQIFDLLAPMLEAW